MTDGITIGQAAAFAGVTVKTIRHYHQNGLIYEPHRDSSGYRRYGTADLLRAGPGPDTGRRRCTAGRDRHHTRCRSRSVRGRARRCRGEPHQPDRRADRSARDAAPTRPRRSGSAARQSSRAAGPRAGSRNLGYLPATPRSPDGCWTWQATGAT
ncbi:MerR family transcriptional regulator [Streptomyces gibsoniae]|uniref:MerR family transcriptional regulator n=1 Tax=Streptomyces gibsoniae TaxID=3075529 RepID=A0ABU2U0A5_9ACTN|nr:MerR family transcriptional regulator [Streptomyces sp. DSM 41699]MDT0466653.1 MerR family transcriptional regulator [Streptomyces sp. DSM 41699]